MAKKNGSDTATLENPTVNGSPVPNAQAPESEDFDNIGDGIDDGDFGDDAEAVPASQTAAALSAALPADVKPRRGQNDGRKALALRLTPDQMRRVRVKAMVEGVKPADLVAALIDTHVKKLHISEV
jgi:hypothetical protein